MSVNRLVFSITVFLMASSTAFAATRDPGDSYALRYEGGNAELKQHRTVKVTVTRDEVVFVQHGKQVAVPVGDISGISCATNTHRRAGAAVLGRIPLVELDKRQTRYVGITLADGGVPGANRSSGELVFRMNRGEYRSFLTSLQRLTGKQAVDTGKTPSVVRYRD